MNAHFLHEILEKKHKYHCKVSNDGSVYSFTKDGITYSTDSSVIKIDGVIITDEDKISEIIALANNIFVPTDPELKKAMSEMGMRAILRSLNRKR